MSYNELVGRLRILGFTLRGWAREQGFSESIVYRAARGERHGHTSRVIRAQLAALLK